MRKLFYFVLIFFGSFIFIQKINAASIDSISPFRIAPGEIMTIIGTKLGDSSLYKNIYFGNTIVYPLSWSDNKITIKVPANFSQNKGKVEISGSFDIGEKCYDSYCYQETAYQTISSGYFFITPQIASISPSKGVGGDLVYIKGSYFGNSKGKIKFGYQDAEIISWSDLLIIVRVPLYGTSVITITVNDFDTNSYIFEYLTSLSSDSLSGYQSYLKQVGVDQAWSIQSGGDSNIVVAIIDDGVYQNHPDLINNMWRNYREINGNKKDDDKNNYIDDYYGWNFIDNNNNLTTKGSHGTAVAGIIGASKNNGQGIAGIASGVKIMPIIVCDKSCPREAIIKGIRYAVDMGANIINLSLGSLGTVGFHSEFDEVIKYAYDHNVLIVAATGNSDVESQTTYAGGLGQNLNYIKASPVCNNGELNYVLGVGAVDNNNKVPAWSSYGSDCVDVSAPGVDIYSTSVALYSDYDYTPNSGTSFSAPIVSGIAALIKSKYPYIKNWEIMSKIIYAATNIDIINPEYAGQIGGLVNIKNIFDNNFLNPKLKSVNKNSVNPGESVIVSGEGFLSNYSFRLIGPTFSWGVPTKNLNYKNGSLAEIIIPQDILPAGLYTISLYKNDYSVSQLTNAITINLATTKDDNLDNLNSINNISISDGKIVIEREKNLISKKDLKLINRLSGGILLQVESVGEAWYVYPNDKKKYYLGRPADAFDIMRKLG